MNIDQIIKGYDMSQITIGVLGGHSALDVCIGAKKHGFKTVCVAKRGRELTYSKYYKSQKNGKGCIDEIILVDDFSEVVSDAVQKQLRDLNTVFIHNRYFWTYCDFEKIEQDFQVPIFGTRELLKLEERDIQKNQYYLLEQAGIRIPKMFSVPQLVYKDNVLHFVTTPVENMNVLTLTKVNNAVRRYERENFVASSWDNWKAIAAEKIQKNEILLEDLQKSVIEEFVLGAQINFNFFYSPLTQSLELIGTDTRRQTNLDGWLRLTASEQLKLSDQNIRPMHIETGHIAVTCKESLLEKAFAAGESFVQSCRKHAKELIGPFALQGAIDTNGSKEELIVFDVSMRIPGSPGIMATPYTHYLYGENIGMGERIAMEITDALKQDRILEILT
jgi:5-formaminoimidazole-4-carboxamide-1-(beta)-D-ribofuranosyl 5'-monophosphate synthetase